METKRNKQWRRQKGFYKFKKRLVRLAAVEQYVASDVTGAVKVSRNLHWFELAHEHWTQCYRTTGRPCSCFLCKKVRYNRSAQKKLTQAEISMM